MSACVCVCVWSFYYIFSQVLFTSLTPIFSFTLYQPLAYFSCSFPGSYKQTQTIHILILYILSSVHSIYYCYSKSFTTTITYNLLIWLPYYHTSPYLNHYLLHKFWFHVPSIKLFPYIYFQLYCHFLIFFIYFGKIPTLLKSNCLPPVILHT